MTLPRFLGAVALLACLAGCDEVDGVMPVESFRIQTRDEIPALHSVSDDDLDALAHGVCAEMDGGISHPDDLASSLPKELELGRDDGIAFVLKSVSTFCSRHDDIVNTWNFQVEDGRVVVRGFL